MMFEGGMAPVLLVLVIGGLCCVSVQGAAEAVAVAVADADAEAAPAPAAAAAEQAGTDTIRLQPEDRDIYRRQNNTFVITCWGPQVDWIGPKNNVLKTNNKLSVQTNDTYSQMVFTSLSVSESGNYTCKSRKNSANKSFNLIVSVPVSFQGAMQQTARQSEDATLLCSPLGNPKPEVIWMRDGVPIGKESRKLKVTADGQLLVRNVERIDGGIYVCRATQIVPDDIISSEHIINLTVQHGPEWHGDYAKKGDLVYGYLGGLANLTCVAEAQPTGNITWLRGTKVVKPGSNATIYGDGNNSTLQVNLTEASLFGDYTCKATNALATRERVLVLKWGLRAPPPSKPQPMKAADARHALIRVDQPPPPAAPPTASGPSKQVPTALDLTGLRLLVRPSGKHSSAAAEPRIVDLPFNEDNEYTLPDLQPNTWYEVRAQWRNAAGLSDVSEPGEIHTSEVNSASSLRMTLHLIVLPLIVTIATTILSTAASTLPTDAILSS